MDKDAGKHQKVSQSALKTEIRDEITLSDPTTWTKPWTAVIPLKRTQDAIYEFACHEGNHAIMLGMLAAARVEEKVAEEAAKKASK